MATNDNVVEAIAIIPVAFCEIGKCHQRREYNPVAMLVDGWVVKGVEIVGHAAVVVAKVQAAGGIGTAHRRTTGNLGGLYRFLGLATQFVNRHV